MDLVAGHGFSPKKGVWNKMILVSLLKQVRSEAISVLLLRNQGLNRG